MDATGKNHYNKDTIAPYRSRIYMDNGVIVAVTANAGPDKNITLPTNSVSVTGSGTAGSGTITSTLWSQIAGPNTATNSNPTNLTTTFGSLITGSYTFKFKVTNSVGDTAIDFMQVVVNPANISPTANAGADQSITLPTSTTSLVGTGTDPDGTIVSYLWVKVGGPTGGNITSSSSSTTGITSLQQGTYVYSLTVTDNNGATGNDFVQIVVNAANVSPTANAGANQTITLPQSTTTLTGTGSDPDGSIVAYGWGKLAGPAGGNISSPTSATTGITALQQGTYVFQLTVTDNNGATGTAIVNVVVNAANVAPTANAGADQTLNLPTSSTSISGSASSDPDGTIVSYVWFKISGPAGGTLGTPNSVNSTVTSLQQGTYVYSLTVTDDKGSTGTDFMQIVVNPAVAPPNIPPTSNAGVDQSVTLPTNTATLVGSGNDPDGSITGYLWRKISGPTGGSITSNTSATTGITGLVAGVYIYQLRVTDNSGDTATDAMQLTVNPANQLPSANAGTDQAIQLPTNSTTIFGSGTDPDGSISGYLWRKISGPTGGAITSPTSATTGITGLNAGVYTYQLRVTDNVGDTATDAMQIVVSAANIKPTADAGANQVITLPANTTTLIGSGTDPDGTITAYLWRKLSGPTGGAITSSTSATTGITGLTQGVYLYQLRVTDNSGDTATAAVQITVNVGNTAPNSSAGPDQSINLPTSSTTLDGSGSTDPDGTITAYNWQQISGPNTAALGTPNTVTTTVNGMVEGSYIFRLKVTDNSGDTAVDAIQITVNPSTPLIPPTVNAGSNQSIQIPLDSVSVSATTTGTIVAYNWILFSGNGGTIVNPTSQTTNITNIAVGISRYQVTVTDENGLTATSIVQITVIAAPVDPGLPVLLRGYINIK